MLPTGNSIPFRAGETLGPMAAAALPDSVNMLAAGAGKVGNALGSMASELGSMAPARGQVGAITYHGSPHKFDKFDMSKIGTGEGAQVYGHGLYFAENPEVARQYAEAGAEKYGDLLRIGRHEISRSDWRFDPAISAKRAMDEGESLPKHFNDKEYKWAEAVRSRGLDVEVAQPNMYQVDIPDEHIDKMLDWDKPLSEQPDLLQKLKDAGVFTGSKKFDDWEALIGPGGTYVNPQDSAQRAYIAAQQTLGAAKASELFKSAGIPGIKYLDAGSRGAGNGTRNFVLFDDQIPKILKRE